VIQKDCEKRRAAVEEILPTLILELHDSAGGDVVGFRLKWTWTATTSRRRARGTRTSGATNGPNDCGGWMSTAGTSIEGHSDYVDFGRYTVMTAPDSTRSCGDPARLYCFEQ
jgi:hypothetical protein